MQNDMRDRLIELYKEATTLYFDCLDSIDEKGLTDTEGRAKFTIDHLIANGVILPPCKVGGKDGLYGKYTVVKNSTGKLVTDCFVLKPSSDETARKALLFYADNCNIPQLSADIKEWLQKLKELSEKK